MLTVCVCVCFNYYWETKKILIKYLSPQKCFYWQAERIVTYFSRMPLIYVSLFHIVAVLLAEPSDGISLDVSSECEKISGLCAEVEGTHRSGPRGCPPWLCPQPEEPGTHASVREVEFGQAFLLTLLEAAQGVAFPLLLERAFSLNPEILSQSQLLLCFFSFCGGKGSEFGAVRVQGRTGLPLAQSFSKSVPYISHLPSSLLIPILPLTSGLEIGLELYQSLLGRPGSGHQTCSGWCHNFTAEQQPWFGGGGGGF